MFLLVVGILGVTSVGNAQLAQLGQCETVDLMPTFEVDAFATGTWYELGKTSSQNADCANLAFTTSEGVISVANTFVVDDSLHTVTGTATHTTGTARLSLQLSTSATPTAFWVLGTDYNNYAIAMNCVNADSLTREINVWQLGRAVDSYDTAATLTAANNVLSAIGLTVAHLQRIDHSPAACTHNAIILSGDCPNVTGVPSFTPAILDNWYDVAHYPTASQNGSCSRVEVFVDSGGFKIRNLMVTDEQLKVQAGTFDLSRTGYGVLENVTFVLENGEESDAQEYFVLGTDYTSYALVYSCRDLGDGTRQVFSWKLSRTPTMTGVANAAIDDIIRNTEGLSEEHYRPQSHSTQDCYYVPDLVPGQSVLFPGGTCDLVPGMKEFNYTRYSGWWHELERYPADCPRGQCTSIEFTSGSAGSALLDAVEIGVYDGVATETAYRAVVASDGAIVFYDYPAGILRQWYILDTDYDTYSLIYSCEPVVTSWGLYRRVWSAKHSKARSLTTAAQNAINTIIKAHPDLHPHLYESVNQSDSACFYYRPDVGEEVILPGQCDTDIPVQENFDVLQFAGRWYELERYPYRRVSNRSTCIGNRYTVDGDGLTVQNWEVLDGVLNTNYGRATVDGTSLLVTLPVEGGDDTETTVRQILTTDYVNYALVYTCVNINDFQRKIEAFQLGRDRQWTYAGLSAIRDYMNSRAELHRPYFISVLQDKDCNEPSSALLVKSSIFVVLICVTLQLTRHVREVL